MLVELSGPTMFGPGIDQCLQNDRVEWRLSVAMCTLRSDRKTDQTATLEQTSGP